MQTLEIENHDGPLMRIVRDDTTDTPQYAPYPFGIGRGDTLTLNGESVMCPRATMLRTEEDAIAAFEEWQNAGY